MIKSPRNKESELVFDSGSFSKGKSRGVNEDSYFQTATALGVADGVSAWRKYGIDGGQFARELMVNCRDIRLKWNSSCLELVAGLEEAHNNVQAYGSSTALLGFLVNSHILLSALGDSRAIVVRWTSGRPTIVFETEVSVHSFNCPYQLARVPKNLNLTSFIHDTSADSLNYSIEVELGDLLIMGTDGLWDNLYDCDLINLLSQGDLLSPQEIAEMLGKRAFLNSRSANATPFQEAANQAYPGAQWRGGKVDDITVLAAWVITLS